MYHLNYNYGGGAIAAAQRGVRWVGFEGQCGMLAVMSTYVLQSLAVRAREFNHYEDFGEGVYISILNLLAFTDIF